MLLVLPIVIPLLTACLCLLVGHRERTQRALATLGACGLLLASIVLFARVWAEGPLVLYVGGWRAPFGITFVADVFAALMVLVAALMHLAVSVYSLATVGARHQRYGYFVFLNVMLMGVCGAFLTGDLFNLYVWFEVMLIGSFVLLVLGGGRAQMEAGIKYVTLSLLSSALFLAGVGVIYGVAHTLNMADLSERLAEASTTHPWLVVSASILLLLSFGIKAAVFPLYFWLPASYHTPAPAISAIFAGLLTKVGVYALIRVFTVVFPPSDYVLNLLLATAGLTMVMGVLGAVSQSQIRRILSFHIISQIGYMVMGLALLVAPDPSTRRLGIAAAIFYIAHHIVVKTNLFLIGGTVRALTGTERLDRLGGLLNSTPWLGILFLIPALSLAGVPPLSGFWAKLAVIKAGFGAQQYLLTAVALFAGVLTLVSMLKIWSEAFWKPGPESNAHEDGADDQPTRPGRPRRLALLIAPSVALALFTLAIGLYPQALLSASQRAADELLDRGSYVSAVGLSPVEVDVRPSNKEDAP
jgi:multicomponent Na+:H+ antiporter subunit D